MKAALENWGSIPAAQFLVKISAFVFVSVALFYFGEQWSDEDRQLLLFNYAQFTANITNSPNPKTPQNPQTLIFPIPPNYNKTPNYTTRTVALDHEVVVPIPPEIIPISPSSSPHHPSPYPPRPMVERFGIVDENGTMSDEFLVGEFDSDVLEIIRNASSVSEDGERMVDDGGIGAGIASFLQCPTDMMDYIPCLDNLSAVKKLKSTERGQQFERHCPENGKGLNCLIPRPKDYKHPVPWPKSRDEIWYSNVPHTRLVEDKRGENWISIDKDKFRFPGGDIQFIRGTDQYIDLISKMVPDIAFGKRTRVVLDVGCGIASFGASLMSRNVLTMSIAPKEIDQNQIQFALERGVPAMVATFATRRLLFPSQAFDLVHCSRCGIDWTRDDGLSLLEADRVLRAGGYFIWAPQNFKEKSKAMIDLTARLCWELVKMEGSIVIWRKPRNNICCQTRREGTRPLLCDADDDPDNVWYVDLKACISRLPENGYGANVSMWPTRLNDPPERLQTINIDAYISRKELYKAESRYGDEIVGNFVKFMRWKKDEVRNVLDMRAGFGGFAAALIHQKIDCWVMNVVPVSGPNTLPVVYDRGLIGVLHDWCEPFDTYPRTYDFLHASGLFSVERSRCDIGSIILEMDRILRPGGRAYIHDSVTVIYKLQELGNAVGWHVKLRDTAEGPNASYKILLCEKRLDHAKHEKSRHRKRQRKNHRVRIESGIV